MKEIAKHLTFSLRPLVRLADPRKTSVPCHVQCIKITQFGLLAGQPPGTHGRGRSSKKVIRLDLSVRQSNDVPITKKGFIPAYILDHRCNAKLMQNQLFVKCHLVSHNIIANPSQLITQGSGGDDRVRLCRLSVIVAAKANIVSARQLGGF
jgi:hypothetical protein